jgi:inosine-uridine nucleoside N-ribohydrolase
MNATHGVCVGVLHVLGYGADVVAGAAKPLIRSLRTCPEIHGESGLDGHEYVKK